MERSARCASNLFRHARCNRNRSCFTYASSLSVSFSASSSSCGRRDGAFRGTVSKTSLPVGDARAVAAVFRQCGIDDEHVVAEAEEEEEENRDGEEVHPTEEEAEGEVAGGVGWRGAKRS